MGQSFHAATAGLAADTGIEGLVLVPLLVKPLLQQLDPALLGLQPVGRTEAVTETEDDGILRGGRALEPDEQQCQCECPAARQCDKRSQGHQPHQAGQQSGRAAGHCARCLLRHRLWGETVAITGKSGAGKSTLLAMLAGLDLPTTGHLWLDGQDLTTLSEDGRARLRAQRVGFVFQSFHLIPSLTALENVLLPLELAQRDRARILAREALDRVGLTPRIEHYPRQLSGGEQQRVALARAFVIGPAVLFADEPTGNLDANTGQRIIEMMFDMNRTARTTLVLVTHEQSLAARCDRILHMEAGRLVAP